MYDKQRKDVENYYRAFVLPSPMHLTYLKVCVLFTGSASEGIIITAYATTDTQEGEIEKWPGQK
jgi:hypothetical protein